MLVGYLFCNRLLAFDRLVELDSALHIVSLLFEHAQKVRHSCGDPWMETRISENARACMKQAVGMAFLLGETMILGRTVYLDHCYKDQYLE